MIVHLFTVFKNEIQKPTTRLVLYVRTTGSQTQLAKTTIMYDVVAKPFDYVNIRTDGRDNNSSKIRNNQ